MRECPAARREIETTCFRIAQEALTNIARHAHASEVWVTLAGTEEELRLEVRDNGRVSTSRPRGWGDGRQEHGLLSMKNARRSPAGGLRSTRRSRGRPG